MTFLLLIVGGGLPLLVLLALAWLVYFLAQAEAPRDVLGAGDRPRPMSVLGRLRAWLTARPKKLAYRRDGKGRFRRVRRG